MTAIAAVFSKYGIACSTDSMLTAAFNNNNQIIEWEKSKIIKVERCKACISYWGFAGVLKKIPKGNETINWQWNIYDWISQKVSQNRHDNLQDFCEWLEKELSYKLNTTPVQNEFKGIGIHIIGHEFVNGFYIPELFLLTNFNYHNSDYLINNELRLERHSYHTISNDTNIKEHYKQEYRLQVREFLNLGNLLFYNNGDPIFFNPISNTIYNSLRLAQHRQSAKEIQSAKDLIPFVREPISIISKLQRLFYKEGKRVIGGKIHSMAIEPSGRFVSFD